MTDEEIISREDFLAYQRRKWKNRRWMTWSTLIFYFAISILLVITIDPFAFDNYTGFFIQISLFAGTVVCTYFASNSFEEVKNNRMEMVEEFERISEISRNSRNPPKRNEGSSYNRPGRDRNETRSRQGYDEDMSG